MTKEIVLPPHLYDRIRASAGEHGGIGRGSLFTGLSSGTPLCVHGHAWGTCTRYGGWHAEIMARSAASLPTIDEYYGQEPELSRYLSVQDNDRALIGLNTISDGPPDRIPFETWCHLLNVKRGKDEDFITAAPSEQREAVTA